MKYHFLLDASVLNIYNPLATLTLILVLRRVQHYASVRLFLILVLPHLIGVVPDDEFIITQTNYGLRGSLGTFVNFVSGRHFKGSIANTSGVRYVITGSDDGIWINGAAGVQESDNDTPSGNVRLMATGSGKMYECMLWDDNALVRAFVPVIASDGEPCMYDYVTKQCYGSSSGTAFTAGGDIVSTVRHDKSGNIYCAEFNEI